MSTLLEVHAPEDALLNSSIVVLGGGFGVGSASYYRVLKGIELFRTLRASYLILTGSKDESSYMYSIASRYIDPMKIVVCAPSKTTIGNAYYAKLVIMGLGISRVVVVTSRYHIERASKIFEWIFGPSYHIEFYYNEEEPIDDNAVKREEELRRFIPFLELFSKGDHETIIAVAKFLGIE